MLAVGISNNHFVAHSTFSFGRQHNNNVAALTGRNGEGFLNVLSEGEFAILHRNSGNVECVAAFVAEEYAALGIRRAEHLAKANFSRVGLGLSVEVTGYVGLENKVEARILGVVGNNGEQVFEFTGIKVVFLT